MKGVKKDGRKVNPLSKGGGRIKGTGKDMNQKTDLQRKQPQEAQLIF